MNAVAVALRSDQAMQGPPIGREDQVGGVGADVVFLGDGMAVGVPGLYAVVVFGGGVELNAYADEFVVEEIARLFLGEDGLAHILAGSAPGGITVHEDVFIFGFRFRLDGGPAETVFEMQAFVLLNRLVALGDGCKRQQEEEKAGRQ